MSEKSFFRKAAKAIAEATHVIIGAGAGLSEASGIEMGAPISRTIPGLSAEASYIDLTNILSIQEDLKVAIDKLKHP